MKSLTLDDVKGFDVAGTWSRLPSATQAGIGEAFIAWQIAALVSDTTTVVEDMNVAGVMADEAYAVATATIVQAMPEIDWNPAD